MNLKIVLETKKVLRKALFYGRWSPGMKSAMRNAYKSLSLNYHCVKNGLKMESGDGWTSFARGRKKIIIEGNFEALHAAKFFDRFFSAPALSENKDLLDMRKPVKLDGFLIKTTCGMILEGIVIDDYNRHYQLKEGDVVFDCGSFHGVYALYASRKVGKTGMVFAFEPDEKNLAVLCENLERNNAANVRIVKKGVWNSQGRLSFIEGNDATSSVVFSNDVPKGAVSIEVTSIPDFFASQKLSRLDFVKMDIEGAEIEVIGGCVDFLKKHDVNFAAASYHLRDGQETYHALEPMFRSAGYECVTEITGTITTYAWANFRKNLPEVGNPAGFTTKRPGGKGK